RSPPRRSSSSATSTAGSPRSTSSTRSTASGPRPWRRSGPPCSRERLAAGTPIASVPEHAVPRDAMRSHDLPLGLLVAARNAARVALRGLHLCPAAFKWVLVGLGRGALSGPALFAVLGHRSSIRSKLGFSPAYHVNTE